MEGKGGEQNGAFEQVGETEGHGYRWEQGEERLVRNMDQGEWELICRYDRMRDVGRFAGTRRG